MQEQINPEHSQENHELPRKKEVQPNKKRLDTQRGLPHQKAGHNSQHSNGEDDLYKKSVVKTKYTPYHAKHTLYESKHTPHKAKHQPVVRGKGLDPKLAHNIEQMTGVNMEGTTVFEDSDIPAQYGAEALAMNGKEIHLARGKKQHLPEEAAHIARQRLGQVSPDAKMLAHGWSVNTNNLIEQQDRSIGAQAQRSSGLTLQNKESLRAPVFPSGIIQRHPAAFDIIDLMDKPNLKDLGFQAFLALLQQYKKEIGAALIDKMTSLTLAALDPLMEAVVNSVKGGLSETFDKLPAYVKKGAKGLIAMGKFLAGLNDLHPLLAVFGKYALGRGLYSFSQAIGCPLRTSFINTAIDKGTGIVELIGWVSNISERVVNFINESMPGIKEKFADNPEMVAKLATAPASEGFSLAWEYVSKEKGIEGQTFGAWVMSASGNGDLAASIAIGSGLTVATVGGGSLWLLGKAVSGIDPSLSKKVAAVGAAVALGGLAAKLAYQKYYGVDSAHLSDDDQSQNPRPLPDSQEETEVRKRPLQSIDTKFFWLNLDEAMIDEWDSETADDKTGGALVKFGMGFRLFGEDLLSSNNHQLKLDWAGGFDYQGEDINIAGGKGKEIGIKDVLTISQAKIDKIHIDNKEGLKNIELSLNTIKIGPDNGIISAEKVAVGWDKSAGLTLTVEKAEVDIQGHKINGSLDLQLDKAGNLENGTIKVTTNDEIDIVPGTFAAQLREFTLSIDKEKNISGGITASAQLDTKYLEINSGEVTIEHLGKGKGWKFDAPAIEAHISLPGGESVDAQASIRYLSATGDFTGSINAEVNNLTIIQNVLLLNQLSLSGKIKDKIWEIGAEGNGKITIPGGKEINIEANMSLKKDQYEGGFKAELPDRIDAIPNVLGIKNLGFEGTINNEDWGVKMWGGFDLTNKFFSLDAQKVLFSYSKALGWSLDANNIKLLLNPAWLG